MTVPDINWQAAEQSSEANNQPTAADNSTPTEPPHHVDYIEQVNIDVLDNYKTNLIARYEALYQQASEASNDIVVIAQGTSAGVLMEHYADFSDLQINAFISLSSFLPNSQRNARLSQTTSLVTPALLDIYFSGDHNDILMNLKTVSVGLTVMQSLITASASYLIARCAAATCTLEQRNRRFFTPPF